MVAYVRTVKTASGATAVQIVWSSRRGSRSIEHIGSAHDEARLAALKAAATQRLAAGQAELDLGMAGRSDSEPLPITSARSAHLWDALRRGYEVLGFDGAAGNDEVFQQLVLARIIEPTSKADSLRVLEETGVGAPSYPTLNRRLPVFAKPAFRQALSTSCAEHAKLGPASLVLYDVSTLHFETDDGDGFREPGFSKERRLEPQITIGLLTDAAGFPLALEAFEGNRAETATMLPVINAFKTAHQLSDVTVVADAGMISETNQVDLQAAGLTYILGARIPFLPDVIREWRDRHPEEAIPDQLVFHYARTAIDAHLTIVFTTLAVAHAIQSRTELSIARVVKQLRPLRSATININGSTQTLPPAIPEAQRKILTYLGIKSWSWAQCPKSGHKIRIGTQHGLPIHRLNYQYE